MTRYAGAVLATLFLARAAAAQFSQQGSKLVGAGAVGGATQGASVAISADGTTAIVGGPYDDSEAGAAWVYTRSGGVWSQQGSKLVGTGAIGAAYQGASVEISADGNTAIVGGPNDDATAPLVGRGAVWVYTRTGGVWSQQGGKLVGSGAVGSARQGASVAISADGNTAIVGGPDDDSNAGAAWVYTRSGGVWLQQGKLIGTGAFGNAWQGVSVAISADGNSAVVGGPWDMTDTGAAWMYARSGGVWLQQAKLVGAGYSGGTWSCQQGSSVAISANGNTAIVGGFNDNPGSGDMSGTGAAWVFTLNGSAWSQQGSKLVGVGADGIALQGWSVAITADGNTATVGGPYDDSQTGAAWVFTRSGAVWSQQGNKLVGSGPAGPSQQGTSVAISADGSTAIVGGPGDNSAAGAAWVFAASTFSAWVPVASHTSGKNNSQWRSDLGLLNTGSVTANAQITFYGSGGLASSTTYVPAGAQSVVTDVVGQIGAGGSGALVVVSDQALKLTARTYNQISSTSSCYANGTQGQDYPAVAAADGLGAAESAYLAGLAENASYRCNIGVVNVGSAAATVLVELFDGAGAKLGNYAVSLASGQWSQATQPFLNSAGQTALDRGYARITVQAGSGVFAFASVIDNVTNDPTTVAMQQ